MKLSAQSNAENVVQNGGQSYCYTKHFSHIVNFVSQWCF